MRFNILFLVSICFSPLLLLGDSLKVDFDTLNLIRSHYTPNTFFHNRYLHYNLEQYLDNYQELTVYQNETTGDFSRPDDLTFSIAGNSYKWNRYYYNGFRINDGLNAGNSIYKPELNNQGISLDVWNNSLSFFTEKTENSEAYIQWNHGGGFGGPAPYTADLIHLFHRTAREALYVPVEDQRLTKNAFNSYVSTKVGKNNYRLGIAAGFGTRMWLGFNYDGYDQRYYPERFSSVMIDGQMAVPKMLKSLFDSNYYIAKFRGRSHLFTEFYYDKEESAKRDEYGLSYYGKKQTNSYAYTSGLNFLLKNIQHNNINFSRNFIDQDAEGVEPWYTSGKQSQFSHALNYKKSLSAFDLVFDSYNSYLRYSPTVNQFYNTLYYQPKDSIYQSLYYYDWEAKQFGAGLLENSLSFEHSSQGNRVDWFNSLAVTLDGMLLKQNSIVRPNWEFDSRVSYRPFNWLTTTLQVGRKRVPFHGEQLKFISDDYLSGSIYYWNDINQDKEYQEGERLSLFTTTGGKYRSLREGLQQQAYYYVDFPFKFNINKKHAFVFYNQYRKYINQWRVYYNDQDVGYQQGNLFYLNNGELSYEIGEIEKERLTAVNGNDHFLFDSPFFAGSTFKYQFNGKRLFFAVSWTYHQLIGLGSYGNGVLHNDLDQLSESQANPNASIHGVALLDSDKSYIGRMLLAYKFSDKFKASFSFKFKDGQTISSYGTNIVSNDFENQIAVRMLQMKGNNEFNGDHGNREDAFFNSVLRLVYDTKKWYFNASMYNIYDFGTDLSQYSYSPTQVYHRFSLELNIPRGLMVTLGCKF